MSWPSPRSATQLRSCELLPAHIEPTCRLTHCGTELLDGARVAGPLRADTLEAYRFGGDFEARDGDPKLELDVEYLHFGGAYSFSGTSVRPFVTVTAGAAHFSPRLPGFESETFLSGSLGGGVQLRADKAVGVRLEGRLFATFLGHDADIFCHSSSVTNACAFAVASSPLLQWEVGAGIVFRF